MKSYEVPILGNECLEAFRTGLRKSGIGNFMSSATVIGDKWDDPAGKQLETIFPPETLNSLKKIPFLGLGALFFSDKTNPPAQTQALASPQKQILDYLFKLNALPSQPNIYYLPFSFQQYLSEWPPNTKEKEFMLADFRYNGELMGLVYQGLVEKGLELKRTIGPQLTKHMKDISNET